MIAEVAFLQLQLNSRIVRSVLYCNEGADIGFKRCSVSGKRITRTCLIVSSFPLSLSLSLVIERESRPSGNFVEPHASELPRNSEGLSEEGGGDGGGRVGVGGRPDTRIPETFRSRARSCTTAGRAIRSAPGYAPLTGV